MEFLGFCIVVAAFMVCDTWIFLRGYNSFFHEAKTEEEKKLHAAIIKRNTNHKCATCLYLTQTPFNPEKMT